MSLRCPRPRSSGCAATCGCTTIRRSSPRSWRDFLAHVLLHHPGNRLHEHQPRMRTLAWDENPALLAAWREGRTGYPLVDAGMRELRASGWMHNRARLVAGSFPAPAFRRLLNPALQQRRHDPDGAYVRRWVPGAGRGPRGRAPARAGALPRGGCGGRRAGRLTERPRHRRGRLGEPDHVRVARLRPREQLGASRATLSSSSTAIGPVRRRRIGTGGRSACRLRYSHRTTIGSVEDG
ncbi:MAG TPA: FAD-binding domain-containing protein [Conexibacter sp.]|nr:FAD-binding domain-containing protein [Conexibacter sp.]